MGFKEYLALVVLSGLVGYVDLFRRNERILLGNLGASIVTFELAWLLPIIPIETILRLAGKHW